MENQWECVYILDIDEKLSYNKQVKSQGHKQQSAVPYGSTMNVVLGSHARESLHPAPTVSPCGQTVLYTH